MKLVYSLTLSFLLFVFITNLSIAFSNDDNEPVLDLSGKPLIAGNEYYILPSSGRGITGGGIELEKTGNSKCEVTVLQSYRLFSFQTSLKFTNLKNSSEQILTSTPLEIEVTKKPDCAHSSKWIVFVDNVIHKSCLGIGDYRNYNDLQKVSGTFSILKYGKGYQFEFCLDGSGACYDIGRYHHFGEIGKRLYLAEQDPKDPFEFIFLPTSFGIIKSVVA
ncbi:kunitz-type trypsin inhibitor-like 2 protein [Vicia villosa]|uniref:kunitz-type trypsin inhibitor-like 2 protein n=1 Tax=Vicia villosa TaxID=3911 RepID=UPI00273B451D|nr:kunitz-type trypsin inhibitor-like 2 protein [Vicia villosa]XP_058773504.1 kunitz-type trypsin inhibitor-like 2 protein [Vicia villosa]